MIDDDHDEQCESEYVEIAHAYSPCACHLRAGQVPTEEPR